MNGSMVQVVPKNVKWTSDKSWEPGKLKYYKNYQNFHSHHAEQRLFSCLCSKVTVYRWKWQCFFYLTLLITRVPDFRVTTATSIVFYCYFYCFLLLFLLFLLIFFRERPDVGRVRPAPDVQPVPAGHGRQGPSGRIDDVRPLPPGVGRVRRLWQS